LIYLCAYMLPDSLDRKKATHTNDTCINLEVIPHLG